MAKAASKPESSNTLNKRSIAVEQRRQHILQAATTCFLEKGYHQTGMRDIAKHAEVSLGNLYNHFPGKHDMLLGMAELAREEMQPFIQQLNSTAAPTDVLKEFISAYLNYSETPESAILNLEIASEAVRMPDVAALFVSVHNELARALLALIHRGVEQQVFRESAQTLETAQFILDLIESACFRKVIAGNKKQDKESELIEFVLAALQDNKLSS